MVEHNIASEPDMDYRLLQKRVALTTLEQEEEAIPSERSHSDLKLSLFRMFFQVLVPPDCGFRKAIDHPRKIGFTPV
jgi:hypothetical protein